MQPGYFHPYFIPIYAELFMPSLHATRQPICTMRSGKMGIENGQWREIFDENYYITTRSNWYFVGYQQLDVFSFVYFWFYTCTFGYILHQKWALYVYFWAQTTAKLGYTTAILGNRIRIIKQRNRYFRQENFHCLATGLPLSGKRTSIAWQEDSIARQEDTIFEQTIGSSLFLQKHCLQLTISKKP